MKTIIKAETKEQQEHVLKILEKQGYIWQSSEKPTEVIPYERLGEDFIYIYCSDLKKHLTTSVHAEDSMSYDEFILSHHFKPPKVIL